jgi:hypothetical protein
VGRVVRDADAVAEERAGTADGAVGAVAAAVGRRVLARVGPGRDAVRARRVAGGAVGSCIAGVTRGRGIERRVRFVEVAEEGCTRAGAGRDDGEGERESKRTTERVHG